MKKKIVDIKDVDFSIYGTHLHLPEGNPQIDTGYSRCWGDIFTLKEGRMRFGVENVDFRKSFNIEKLEQHRETEEVCIPATSSFVIALAPAKDKLDLDEKPNVEDVMLIAIHPGDVLILKEHTWHSGCFPLEGKSGTYYFMYKVRDEEIYWRDIKGGALEVVIDD